MHDPNHVLPATLPASEHALDGLKTKVHDELERIAPDALLAFQSAGHFAGYTAILSGFAKERGVPDSEVADLVQTVWLQLIQRAADFRRDGGDTSLHGWVLGVLRHKAIDLARARNCHPTGSLPEVAASDALAGSCPDPAEHWQQQCIRQWLNEALAELQEEVPAEQFQILEKHFEQGESWREIGAELHKSAGAARAICNRLVEKLRARLWFHHPEWCREMMGED